jgi:hypothetical protein
MSDLVTINKTLLEQNKILKEAQGGSATAQAKAAENAAEAKTYDTELLSTIKEIHTSLASSFAGASKGDKKSGGLLSGLLGGIGGGIGAIAKSIGSIGLKFGIGMGALGAGIAAFMIALGGADVLVGLMGNGENLKVLIQNFFGAFSLETSLMMGGIIGLAILAGRLKVTATQMAFGMTGIGAGIAGFFLGILLADGVAKLGEMMMLDGKSIAKLIGNFSMAFEKSGKTGVLLITSILGVGALLSLNPAKTLAGALTGALGIAAGMTGMGFGLAGFFLGILAGDGLAKLGDMISLDGSSIAKLIDNFVGAFAKHGVAGVSVLISLLSVGAIVGLIGAVPLAGAVAAGGAALGIAAGMTGIGMGIAGFAFGLLSADGISRLGEMAGLDGKSLAKLLDNFITAFAGDPKRMVVLTGLLAVGALGAFNPAAGPGIAAALTGLGLGIAGFAAGFLVGDLFAKIGKGLGLDGKSLGNLLENIGIGIGKFIGGLGAGTMAALKNLDVDRLKQLGEGMLALGLGLAAFIAAQIAGGVSGAVGGAVNMVKGWFGSEKSKGPIEQVIDVVDKIDPAKLDRLKLLGEGMFHLGKGLAAFASADTSKIGQNILAMEKIGSMDDSSFDQAVAFGTRAQENKTIDFATKSAMNVSGGNVVVNNDNSVINNDNRNSTISQTSVAAKLEPVAPKE